MSRIATKDGTQIAYKDGAKVSFKCVRTQRPVVTENNPATGGCRVGPCVNSLRVDLGCS